MKPAGIILTFMSRADLKGSIWVKLRTAFFNLCLFVFQFVFMVMATVYGKIQWDARRPRFVDYTVVPVCIFGIVAFLAGATGGKIGGVITFLLLFLVSVILYVILVATYREMPLRRVWRAAQCSHVRLCLGDIGITLKGIAYEYRYINFGYPKAEIKPWRLDQCDGKRFEYRDPTFETSDRFIEAMIEYAEDQVGKRYDEVQLLSPAVNFLLWIFWWPWWGQEKIKAFNRPGGLEYCMSGVVANLRWAERQKDKIKSFDETIRLVAHSEKVVNDFIGMVKRLATRFFKGYDPAVLPPCLIAIDENWEKA